MADVYNPPVFETHVWVSKSRASVALPPGGTVDQVLKKNSNTSGDVVWAEDETGGGGGGGAVDSVNTKTGVVVLNAVDVGAATTAQGARANTAVQPADLSAVATSGSYTDLSGKPTIPSSKADVGLGNVDNTSDVSKPVSTAQATAIGAKYSKPGTGIPGADLDADTQTSLGKADGAVPATRTVAGHALSVDVTLEKGDVGLSNVDNTADALKPVSTPQATAILAATQVATNAKTASYTLVLSDAGKAIDVTSASATNVTIPQNSSVAFPIGSVIEIAQLGAGQVTVVAGTGTTLTSSGALVKTRVQYSSVSIRKLATNTWLLVGDLA